MLHPSADGLLMNLERFQGKIRSGKIWDKSQKTNLINKWWYAAFERALLLLLQRCMSKSGGMFF